MLVEIDSSRAEVKGERNYEGSELQGSGFRYYLGEESSNLGSS